MTTPAFSHDSDFSDDPAADVALSSPIAVRLSDPGDLISALPALLGFRPQRSVVAICLSGQSRPRVGAVMRHDLVLDGKETGAMAAAMRQFGAVSIQEDACGVILVLVDDRLDGAVHGRWRCELAAVVDELEEVLAPSDVHLLDVFVTTDIDAGAAWFDLLDAGHRGILPDPSASKVAVAQVVGGRAIRSSRAELEEVVEAGPELERLRIADLVDAARDSVVLARDLARTAQDPYRGDRRELRRVLTDIARVASGEVLLASECADLALALTNLAVRDALLALAVGDQADAAEQLWMLLARTLPDPERAGAATLLGYSAYVRGDGPLAGVALAAALDSDPAHNLARLLDNALQSGLRPEAVRELAGIGFEVARRIGIDLPEAID